MTIWRNIKPANRRGPTAIGNRPMFIMSAILATASLGLSSVALVQGKLAAGIGFFVGAMVSLYGAAREKRGMEVSRRQTAESQAADDSEDI